MPDPLLRVATSHYWLFPVVTMDAIAVSRQGKGPEVLLVDGGASPSTTWGALVPLQARWTLALVHRRGYALSPSPPDGRHDFEVDAADLASLLDARPHVVAHSYGALGTLIAATRMLARVRSLTLIEPPLLPGARQDRPPDGSAGFTTRIAIPSAWPRAAKTTLASAS